MNSLNNILKRGFGICLTIQSNSDGGWWGGWVPHCPWEAVHCFGATKVSCVSDLIPVSSLSFYWSRGTYSIPLSLTLHRLIPESPRYQYVGYFEKVKVLCTCVWWVASVMSVCDPMDCSLPSSSVRGILLARILGWFAVPLSRGSSQPRDRTCVSYVSCIGR